MLLGIAVHTITIAISVSSLMLRQNRSGRARAALVNRFHGRAAMRAARMYLADADGQVRLPEPRLDAKDAILEKRAFEAPPAPQQDCAEKS